MDANGVSVQVLANVWTTQSEELETTCYKRSKFHHEGCGIFALNDCSVINPMIRQELARSD
jgi:hypothetical protein